MSVQTDRPTHVKKPMDTDAIGEALFLGITLLLSLVMAYYAFGLPKPNVETPLPASFWPLLILVPLSLVLAARLIILLRSQRTDISEGMEQPANGSDQPEALDWKLFLFGLSAALLYIINVKYVGFIVATPIVMVIYLWGMGYRKPVALAIIPITVMVVLLLLFVKVTFIPLPRGYGIFREFSLLFY